MTDNILESCQQLWTAFAAVQEGAYLFIPKTGQLIFSPSYYEMLGYEYEEFEMSVDSWVQLLHPEDRGYATSELSRLIDGEIKTYKIEFRMRRKSGEYLWIRSQGSSIPLENEGSKIIIIGAHIDISEQKILEERLTKALQEAESASKAKGVFLASMTHELRTPLNGVLGYAQLVAKSQLLTPDLREYVEFILKSGDHLLSLVNEILDLSKGDYEGITLESNKINLRTLLEYVCHIVDIKIEGDKILSCEISEHLPSKIVGDEKRLQQILINLIRNADKFTKKGEIRLKVSPKVLEESKVMIYFEISDTGIGIAADETEHIFEPFFQSNGMKVEGTGLGLSITQNLVRLMGGEIQVTSVFGEGSKFWFELEFPIASNEKLGTLNIQTSSDRQGEIESPPLDFLEEFYCSAFSGDVMAMHKQLDELPEYDDFKEHIRKLLKKFRINLIKKFIEEALKAKPPPKGRTPLLKEAPPPEFLKKLVEPLTALNPAKVKPILSEMIEAGYNEFVSMIQRQLDQFEYHEALEIVNKHMERG